MAQQFRGRVDFGRTPPEGPLIDSGLPMPVTLSIDGDTADIRVGGSGVSGDVRLFSKVDSLDPTIHIDGAEGDIKLMGGDCAEDFDIAPGHEATEPGSVMCLDASGKLCQSASEYDHRVVGIVSGGRDFGPGMILGRVHSTEKRLPIALVGKVFCKVDARSVPIETGDLLTSSSLPGHAMKAENSGRSFGATIGKALGSLEGRTGLIPVLVALQ